MLFMSGGKLGGFFRKEGEKQPQGASCVSITLAGWVYILSMGQGGQPTAIPGLQPPPSRSTQLFPMSLLA